jgi:hypothetical protein
MVTWTRGTGHEIGELQTLMPRTLQLAQPRRDFLCTLRFLPGGFPPTFPAGIVMELLDQNGHRLAYFLDAVIRNSFMFSAELPAPTCHGLLITAAGIGG